MKYFVYAIISIVAVSVLAGFFVAGSPREERMRRFDERRIHDMQNMQWQIQDFYRAKGTVPERLSELEDSFRGIVVPKDPETGEAYEYTRQSANSFTLCASFNRPGPSSGMHPYSVRAPYPYERNQIWDHGEGQACFERTIDEDFFPRAKE